MCVCVSLWGGLSEDGFAPILWHPGRKTNTEEWVQAIRTGKVTEALRFLNPRNKSGPWTILCDGESFLRAKAARVAYLAKKVSLWFGTCEEPRSQPSGTILGLAPKKIEENGFS